MIYALDLINLAMALCGIIFAYKAGYHRGRADAYQKAAMVRLDEIIRKLQLAIRNAERWNGENPEMTPIDIEGERLLLDMALKCKAAKSSEEMSRLSDLMLKRAVQNAEESRTQ